MLTATQIAAIVGLLMAFGVDPSEVNKIEILLKPPVVQVLGSVPSPTIYQPTYSTPVVATDTPPTPRVLVTPIVAVQQAPPPAPTDTTPPKYVMCQLFNGTVQILSNEKLSKIEASVGTLGTPNVDGVWQPSKNYYYEIPIQMPTRYSQITIYDLAGNSEPDMCRIDTGPNREWMSN